MIGDDGIYVSWAPPNVSSVYIIYYESINVSEEVSVSAAAGNHTLRNLVFGNKYNVSIGTQSDFQSSAIIGPKEIIIGKTTVMHASWGQSVVTIVLVLISYCSVIKIHVG